MNYKPFSTEDYKQFDALAKKTASEFLVDSEIFYLKTPIEQQTEAYKCNDFEIFSVAGDNRFLVEAEIKKVWKKTATWEGYSTIHIPYRKRFSKAHFFIMINAKTDTLLITKMPDILGCNVIKKDCKCSNVRTNQESFFDLPLSMVTFYTYWDGKWKQFKVNS